MNLIAGKLGTTSSAKIPPYMSCYNPTDHIEEKDDVFFFEFKYLSDKKYADTLEVDQRIRFVNKCFEEGKMTGPFKKST